MQGCTHFLFGVGIQRLTERVVPKQFQLLSLAVVGTATHVMLDDLARITYHPHGPAAVQHLTWPLMVMVGAIFLASLAVFWRYRQYWKGMLAAVIPDTDWVIRPFLWLFRLIPDPWHDGFIHEGIRELPGLSHFHEFSSQILPDLRFEPTAILVELVLVGALFTLIIKSAPTSLKNNRTPN